MNLIQIGIRLQQVRKRANLTQEQIAVMIGKERSVYARMEKGKSAPTLETLSSLKEKLKLSIDWLISGKGTPYENDSIFDVFSRPGGEIPDGIIEKIREGAKPDPDIIRTMATDMLQNPKFYGKTLIEYLLIWKDQK